MATQPFTERCALGTAASRSAAATLALTLLLGCSLLQHAFAQSSVEPASREQASAQLVRKSITDSADVSPAATGALPRFKPSTVPATSSEETLPRFAGAQWPEAPLATAPQAQPKPPANKNPGSDAGNEAKSRPPAQSQKSAGRKVVITVGLPDKIMNDKSAVAYKAVTFADLPRWADDDHLSAFKAFLASCPAVASTKPDKSAAKHLSAICEFAQSKAAAGKMTRATARTFFETYFRPKSVEQASAAGLLTGYYEPLLQASRTPTAEFKTPIYRRPADLVNVVAESERGAKSAAFTHMRQTGDGLKPYLTRAEIETGALSGQGLELLYFRDAVDVYFLQVQGSGRIQLPNGESVRITYDGKNGYPYTSIGRELIQAGTFTPDTMSLGALAAWLKADRKRAEPVMRKNQSYVFFREMKGEEADGAIGALGTPLHVGRSLAVDTAYHALGLPIYVSAPAITHAPGTEEGGFNRLMVAHDVGSAIKGPERGDIYFGSGDKAGRVAGVTKHPGHFYVLEPAPLMEASGDAKPAGKTP